MKTIYENLVAAGMVNVAVVGDLNNAPTKAPLASLLQQTNLRDVSTHSHFNDGGRPGTYDNCVPSQTIDYLLLSPSLFERTQEGGIFREGIWGGENGTLFPHLPEITHAAEAASDHAAIWAENIPFNETRDYVRKVLLGGTVYAQLLGLPATPALAAGGHDCPVPVPTVDYDGSQTDFESSGGPTDPRVFNGGCKDQTRTAPRCTRAWCRRSSACRARPAPRKTSWWRGTSCSPR